MARVRFDLRKHSGLPMVAATGFTYGGKDYLPGDPFPTDGLDPRRVATMHGARRINFETDPAAEALRERREAREAALAPPAADPITTESQPGGYYLITAPWLSEPLRVRGKAAAENEERRIRQEGQPLGFIDGGSVVEIADVGGGWYEITAPWLAEPEKRQGRDEAESRQRELHDAGEPETYAGVTLREGDNGWWAITREGVDVELKIQGEERARESAAKLRAGEQIEGQPIEWTELEPLKPGDVVLVSHEGSALDGQRGTIDKIDGDQARVVGFPEGSQQLADETLPLTSLTVATVETTEGPAASVLVLIDGDKHVVTAPWLDGPETFDDAAAAEARQAELRDAGPPDGWVPAAPADQESEVTDDEREGE